ncbi:hypothetical protein IF2G_01859 [Cordyceps javanica]|nr:hypothetical protein IF2G_01859 [Cordyceps javanica]
MPALFRDRCLIILTHLPAFWKRFWQKGCLGNHPFLETLSPQEVGPSLVSISPPTVAPVDELENHTQRSGLSGCEVSQQVGCNQPTSASLAYSKRWWLRSAQVMVAQD